MIHKDRIAIHTSDRRMFKRCRRKYSLASNLERGLEPKRPNSILWLGTGVHKALELWYASNLTESLPELFASWVNEERARLAKDAFMGEVDDSASEIGLEILSHYEKVYGEADKKYKPYKMEVMFSIPIANPDTGEQLFVLHPATGEEVPVTYDGRLDGILEDEDGYFWILEHKTARSFSDWDVKIPMDEQISSYIWAAEYLFGINIKGVIYNGLRKTSPRVPELLKSGKGLSKNKAIDTTYEVYLQAILDNDLNPDDYTEILDHLKTKGNAFFRRDYVSRSKDEVIQQQLQIYQEAKDMLSVENYYPNPTRDCSWDCDFKEVCSILQARGDAEPVIDMMYQQRESEEETFQERI